MSHELDKEIDDLVDALKAQSQDLWIDEVAIPLVAGRCAGSYGCSVKSPKKHPARAPIQAEELGGRSLEAEMAGLLEAGVTRRSAIAALERKYRGEAAASQALAAWRNAQDDDAPRDQPSLAAAKPAPRSPQNGTPF